MNRGSRLKADGGVVKEMVGKWGWIHRFRAENHVRECGIQKILVECLILTLVIHTIVNCRITGGREGNKCSISYIRVTLKRSHNTGLQVYI